MKYGKKLDWVGEFDKSYYESIIDENNKLWFNPREDDTSEYCTVILFGEKHGVVSLTTLSEEDCYYLQAIVGEAFMVNLPIEIHKLNNCLKIYMVVNKSEKQKIKFLNFVGFKSKHNIKNLDNRIIEQHEVAMVKSF